MPNDEVYDFQCPQCGKRLKAGAALAGRRLKCPNCAQPVIVPSGPPSTASPTPSQQPAGTASQQPRSSGQAPSDVSPSEQPASSAMPLKKVPVVNADDDWLNLGAPAIADLSARQQAVEENKQAKERERTARKNRQEQRRAGSPVTAQSLEQASQRRLGNNSRPSAVDKPDDDLPGLAPLSVADAGADAPSARPAGEQKTEVKRSIFDDDLPELAELQSPQKSKSPDKLLAAHAGIDLSELEKGGPGSGTVAAAKPAQRSSPPKQALDKNANATPQDKDPEYRIECKACGTAQYVRLSRQGKKIKCPDCYLEFRIPPPPPGWSSKKKPKLQLTGEDIPLHADEEAHSPRSQHSRAAQLLQKAQDQVSDEDLDRLYDGDFDTAGFVQRTFGFFKDPVAVAHVVGFGIVFAGVFALGQLAANNLESREQGGFLMLAVIGAPVVGILFALPMLSGALALLESVANRQKQVSEWPGFNLFDNAADIAAITFALFAALLPGFLIGSWLGGEGAGAGRIQIAGMMVTTFALFPIFLLSILDNGSLFAPLSSSVFRSLSEATEDWGGYYLKTLIAFAGTMLMWLLLLGKHEALAAAAGFLLPLLVFFTCQQLGALADAIGEHLSFEWVPPGKEAEGDADKSIGPKAIR